MAASKKDLEQMTNQSQDNNLPAKPGDKSITEFLCLRLKEALSAPIEYGACEMRITYRAGAITRYELNRLESNLIE